MTEATSGKIKAAVWSAIGGAIITMIVGFAWGGWVSGSSSQNMGEKMAQNAILERLTPICVAQFNQDPEKATKIEEFKKTDSWKRSQYVQDQGWATMPFETEPDGGVANRCSDLIMEGLNK